MRTVQLCRRGHEINLFSAMELPLADSEDTTIANISTETEEDNPDTDKSGKEVKHLLETLYQKGEFCGTSFIIHCPADRLDLRPITLPAGAEKLPHDTMVQTIRLQMKPHIHFNIDEAIIDYYPLSTNNTTNHKLIAVTADGAWIRQRVKQLHAWGWQCAGVIPLPSALSRLAKTITPDSPALAEDTTQLLKPILCIGHHHMVLTVHLDEGPVFSRVFDFGGEAMADALALRLQVNFAQAHQLIRTYGLSGPEHAFSTLKDTANSRTTLATMDSKPVHPHQEIARAVRVALRDEVLQLAEGLTRALNYIINEYPQAKLGKVYCCGGGAHTPGLTEELGAQLDWPVAIINHPLLNEIQNQWPVSRAPAGQWATALALAYPQEDLTP